MKSFVFQRWVRQAFGVRGRQHAVVSRRRLGLESLEDRRLLAGDITASLAAGSLTLVGGSADDSLVITQSSTGDLVVTGLNGTTINGNTEYTAKVLHNLTIRTNDGNDSITIQGAAIPGDLTINTGNGDDTVVLAGQTVTPDPAAEQTEEEEVIPTSVGRNLSIVMGSGQDSLNLGGAEEEEEGGGGGNGGGGSGVTVQQGEEDDSGESEAAKAPPTAVQIGGSASVTMSRLASTAGPEDDKVVVHATDITRGLTINTGNGNDTVVLGRGATSAEEEEANDTPTAAASTLAATAGVVDVEHPPADVHIGGALNINTDLPAGTGNDTVVVRFTEVHLDTNIRAGAGNNTIAFGRGPFPGASDPVPVTTAAVSAASTGGGSTSAMPPDVRLDGNLNITTLGGSDTVRLRVTSVNKNLSINTGAGADKVSLGRVSEEGTEPTTPTTEEVGGPPRGLDVRGRTNINLGAGNDLLSLARNVFYGHVTADGGPGADTLDANMDMNEFKSGFTKVSFSTVNL